MSKLNNPLMDEFYKYESSTQLTKDERSALLEWVKDGNSVHYNPSLAKDGHGHYLDFIDDYRHQKEIEDTLLSMNPKERENYLAYLRGEDTIDNLKATIERLRFENLLMEKVIRKHSLQAEVEHFKAESISYSTQLEEMSIMNPLEELPFTEEAI